MATRKKDVHAKTASRNSLELTLRRLGRELAERQVCRFFKVPEEMQKTPCDFMGYTRDGTALLIEAKMNRKNSLAILKANQKGDGISAYQLIEMYEAEKAGAICMFIWQREDRAFIFSPSYVMFYANKRKSIAWMPQASSPIDQLDNSVVAFINEQLSTLRQILKLPEASHA